MDWCEFEIFIIWDWKNEALEKWGMANIFRSYKSGKTVGCLAEAMKSHLILIVFWFKDLKIPENARWKYYEWRNKYTYTLTYFYKVKVSSDWFALNTYGAAKKCS